LGVAGNRDDQMIEDLQAALDDVKVTIGYRIK